MTAGLKRLLRAVLPAPLRAALTAHRRLRFSGPYQTWADARHASTGYDAPAILERMTASARAVAAGQAAYERDTVLFRDPTPDPLLLAEITALTKIRPAGVRVLDFGGALGSTWFQHRPFLAGLGTVAWHVVEQPFIAERGRTEFTNPNLTFHDSIESALASGPPDLVLLSSVLQYLEAPWSVLERLASLPASVWLITRTPFADALASDTLVVQHVPATIYPASYPAWIFSPDHFAAFWTARHTVLGWHPCSEGSFRVRDLSFTFRTALIRSK
jgi:putative methyltransferase (TIGR04325 family)